MTRRVCVFHCIASVPAGVQTTLKEEAKGATIAEVDKISEDGQTVYEADVEIKGKSYEIQVAEDGTLVSKKWERNDDDKDGVERGERQGGRRRREGDEVVAHRPRRGEKARENHGRNGRFCSPLGKPKCRADV
jgi:hypothetical protein